MTRTIYRAVAVMMLCLFWLIHGPSAALGALFFGLWQYWAGFEDIDGFRDWLKARGLE